MEYVNKNLDNLSDIKLSGWYRFSGGAGVQMADTCPRMYSCSTNSSGWLSGTHPTVAEGIVKRKVCFSQRASQFFNDCCYHSKNISVRNCGAFYVYRLDPPDYYSRYCGNGLPQAPGKNELSPFEVLILTRKVSKNSNAFVGNKWFSFRPSLIGDMFSARTRRASEQVCNIVVSSIENYFIKQVDER